MKTPFKRSVIISISTLLILTIGLILVWLVVQNGLTYSGDSGNMEVDNELLAYKQEADIYNYSDSVIVLSQGDFSPADIARARLSVTIRYRCLEDGKVFTQENILPAIRDAIERLNSSRPSVHGPIELPEMLSYFIFSQYPPKGENRRNIALMDDTPEDPEIAKQEAIFKELKFNVATVKCDNLNVNLLELIERVSKGAQVDVGLQADGRLVFGHAGKWASSNRPTFLLEFSDQQ